MANKLVSSRLYKSAMAESISEAFLLFGPRNDWSLGECSSAFFSQASLVSSQPVLGRFSLGSPNHISRTGTVAQSTVVFAITGAALRCVIVGAREQEPAARNKIKEEEEERENRDSPDGSALHCSANSRKSAKVSPQSCAPGKFRTGEQYSDNMQRQQELTVCNYATSWMEKGQSVLCLFHHMKQKPSNTFSRSQVQNKQKGVAPHIAHSRARKLLTQESADASTACPLRLKCKLQKYLKLPLDVIKETTAVLRSILDWGSSKRGLFYIFAFVAPKPPASGHC